jgi:hypothetical protein
MDVDSLSYIDVAHRCSRGKIVDNSMDNAGQTCGAEAGQKTVSMSSREPHRNNLVDSIAFESFTGQ